MVSKNYKKENYAYISIITSDDYLPGLLVLHKTLINTGTEYPFLVLLTSDVSTYTISILEKQNIQYKVIDSIINNPTDVDKKHRWFSTYSKLHVFNQTQYDKIVYLDADILVLKNIDELFKNPHMSATNASSMLPSKSSRTYLNSGIFVLEPSHELFGDMISKIGKIEKLESNGSLDRPKYGSDQDFLNAFYSGWVNDKKLHLFHYYLDEYNSLFNYSIKSDSVRPISIIHYASYLKPWNMTKGELNKISLDPKRKLESEVIQLWLSIYNEIKP
jgi:glycogenin glucosyltransferase